MEYLGKILKKTGWSSILTSTIFAIIGIVLIASPEATITIISTILGLTLIAFGGYKVIEYLRNKGYDAYTYDLAYGIIAIILGIVAMVYHQEIGTIFRILIGLWIIYSSVIRVTLSLKLKTTKSKVWIYSLIIALVMLTCGIYTISNAGTIVVAVGIVVLIYSVLDIIEGIIFLNNLKKIA
ncbi:MAG: hypothetical protein HFJ32_00100 [Clostridia bacterium]|nr:hypothetical protein [Clostridia bacterium]